MSELAVTNGQAIHAPDPRVDAAGVVIGDVSCIGCAYNVRSLALDADCPECGRAVGDTLRYGQVLVASRRWLRRVIAGVTLCVAGQVVGLLSFLWLGVDFFSRLRHFGSVPVWLGASFVLGSLGVWVLTTIEPGMKRSRGSWRFVLRAVGVVVGGLAGAWTIGAVMIQTPNHEMWGIAMRYAVWGVVLTAPVLWYCQVVYLRRLASQIGEQRLVVRTKWFLRIYVVTVGTFVAAAVLGVAANTLLDGTSDGGILETVFWVVEFIMSILALITAPVLLILHVWATVLLARYGVVLGQRLFGTVKHIDEPFIADATRKPSELEMTGTDL